MLKPSEKADWRDSKRTIGTRHRFRRLQCAEVEPRRTNMNPAIKVSKPNGGYRDVGKAEQRSLDCEPGIRRPESQLL